MSKRGIVPIEIKLADEGHEFRCNVREPGIVRHLGFALKPKKVAIVSLTSKQPEAGQQFDETAVLFFECDPEGERRERTFAVVPVNRGIEAPPGSRVEWVATNISQRTGVILNIFELVKDPSTLDAIGQLVTAKPHEEPS